MSLAISFCTCHGIVMSADRAITTTTKDGKSFLSSENDQKLFLSQKGYGFSYTGQASYRNRPASYWMNRFIKRFDLMEISLADYLWKLAVAFHCLDAKNNIILIGCGYQDGNAMVYSTNSSTRKITDHLKNRDTCIAFSGESTLAKKIIDIADMDTKSYNLTDAIEYLKFVTFTVSRIQKFYLLAKTVGPVCDVLKIVPTGSEWIVKPLAIDQ